MPELPDVIPGEPVESDWGNDIRDRVTSRYQDATDRAASEPLPQTGQITWLDDPGQLDYWDGTDWIGIVDDPALAAGLALKLNLSGGTLTGPLTQRPDALTQAAAVGGVIQRWNGDGDGFARAYEWRRGPTFGSLEFWAQNQSAANETLLATFDAQTGIALWHPRPWTFPTLGGGWTDFGGGFQTTRYRRLASGLVTIQGMVTGGSLATGTILFVLPADMRPTGILIMNTYGSDNIATRTDIEVNGEVRVIAGWATGWNNLQMVFSPG